MKTKSFDLVEVGDIATDYAEYKMKVLGKGTVTEMFDEFGDRFSMGLTEFLGDDVTEDMDAVAVQDDPHPQGDVSIYLYDPAGAVVYLDKK